MWRRSLCLCFRRQFYKRNYYIYLQSVRTWRHTISGWVKNSSKMKASLWWFKLFLFINDELWHVHIQKRLKMFPTLEENLPKNTNVMHCNYFKDMLSRQWIACKIFLKKNKKNNNMLSVITSQDITRLWTLWIVCQGFCELFAENVVKWLFVYM